MKKGDKFTFKPKYKEKPVTGEIIWIHPKMRFALLEFQVMTPIGISPPLRECFQIRPSGIYTKQK